MAFMVKSMVGGQLKNLTGGLGGGEEKGEAEKSPAEAQGMTKEEYEEYQKQLVEEKYTLLYILIRDFPEE
uniref:Complexin 3 n=1 Tax=Anolis carolinensis TaxID=28377 RepID=A0A803TNZ6_ANOCA